jgi:hypothetical protein
MNVLARVVKAVADEISTPETFRKGDDFVSFTRNVLFPKDKYALLQRTHAYAVNREDYVESSQEPDLKLRGLRTGTEFYVEAKFRADFFRGAVECCKPYQLERYCRINAGTPVLVALGVGGQPDAPAQVFLVPVAEMKYAKLFRSYLNEYEIDARRPMDDRLVNHLIGRPG